MTPQLSIPPEDEPIGHARHARTLARFSTAWTTGSAVATALFAWMVTAGTWDPLRRERINSNFYDAQARAFLDGRLDLAPEILNIEGFTRAGKTYMYFPPLPALFRLPFVAVTDSLDGRLTGAFLLVAFVVAMAASGALVWRLRGVVRGTERLGGMEGVAIGLFALAVGVSTPLFFASSRAWVYHEAALWGVAFALCAYDQIIAFLRRPSGARLARAGAFAGAALLSRPTVGAGPLVALALVSVGAVSRWERPRQIGVWFGIPEQLGRGRRWLGGLVSAVAVPAAISVAVNYAKFRTPFNLPYDRQAQNQFDAYRRQALAANDGSLFTIRAIPTQLLQLLRPDGIAFSRTFPWIGFPAERPHVVGDLLFDRLDPTVSITAGMTLVTVLAVLGTVVVLRRSALAPIRTCMLGALVALPATLSFLSVAQRYATDALALVLLPAIAGFVVAGAWLERRATPVRWGVLAGLAALVAVGTWTGFATALGYQRSVAPLIDEGLRRQYVEWQSDIAAALGTGRQALVTGDRLPEPLGRDGLMVVGDCVALYVSDGFEWHAVERGRDAGHRSLAVRFPAARPGTAEPLLAVGSGPEAFDIAVEYRRGDRAVVSVPQRGLESAPFDATRPSTIDIVVDARLGQLRVDRNGVEILGANYDGPAGPLTVGTDPDDPTRRFTGRIAERPTRVPVCREVVRRAG